MADTYQRRWGSGGRRGGRSVSDETRTSYYGLPVIKKAHWGWEIVVYFFIGGISAGSYVIATVADLVGGADGQRIARVGRYLSLAMIIPSPVLLILDLGRPERFLHMLRVVKLRSPMSLGTWGLTGFGLISGLSAVTQAAHDGLFGWVPPLDRLLRAVPQRSLGVVGSLFGFFVGGYTGVLLAATAVPLWAKNYLLMGPLFLASAISTAAAAIGGILALLHDTPERTLKQLERLEIVVLGAEAVMHVVSLVNLGPILGRPLHTSRTGQLFRWGVIGAGIVAPLALNIANLQGKPSRSLTAFSALLTLVGGFLLRYVMVVGGHTSADDPEATFVYARRKEPKTGTQ